MRKILLGVMLAITIITATYAQLAPMSGEELKEGILNGSIILEKVENKTNVRTAITTETDNKDGTHTLILGRPNVWNGTEWRPIEELTKIVNISYNDGKIYILSNYWGVTYDIYANISGTESNVSVIKFLNAGLEDNFTILDLNSSWKFTLGINKIPKSIENKISSITFKKNSSWGESKNIVVLWNDLRRSNFTVDEINESIIVKNITVQNSNLLLDPIIELDTTIDYDVADVQVESSTSREGIQLKWNISPLLGRNITNVYMNLYIHASTGTSDNATNYWRINDQTWDEGSNPSVYGAQEKTNATTSMQWSSIAQSTWTTLNITPVIITDLNLLNNYSTIRVEDDDYLLSDINTAYDESGLQIGYTAFFQTEDREQTFSTANVPFLNITINVYDNLTWSLNSTSGTTAGSSVIHSVKWTTGNLKNYKFFFNNGGSNTTSIWTGEDKETGTTIISPSSTYSYHRYNFSDSTNNKAYQNRSIGMSSTQTYTWAEGFGGSTAAIAGAYTNMSLSGDSKLAYYLANGTTNTENFGRFDFNIKESNLSSINWIYLTLRGQRQAAAVGEDCRAVYATFTGNTFTAIGTDITTDATKTVNITNSISNIINATTKNITMEIQSQDMDSNEGCLVDFVQAEVQYNTSKINTITDNIIYNDLYDGSINSSIQQITAINIQANITGYNNNGSVANNNENPILQVQIEEAYTGDKLPLNFTITGTGIYIVTTTNQTIINDWIADSTASDIYVRMILADWNTTEVYDSIEISDIKVILNTTQFYLVDTGNFSGSTNWTNITKTLNSTINANISWYVEATNVDGITNTTNIFSYLTTSGTPTSTCTPPATTTNDWLVTCSDACNVTGVNTQAHSLNLTGTGQFNVTAAGNLTLTGGLYAERTCTVAVEISPAGRKSMIAINASYK